jgi:hypothetical protein
MRRSVEQIVRGDALQEGRCGDLVGDLVGHGHRPGGGYDDQLGIARGSVAPGDALTDRDESTSGPIATISPAPSLPGMNGSVIGYMPDR